MSRRRRQKDPTAELITAVAGLLIFGWMLSPKIRAIAGWLVLVVVVTGAILLALVVYLRRKKRQRGQPLGQPQSQPQAVNRPWSGPVAPRPSSIAVPTKFTHELLSELEWRRFEILVTLFFQKTGYDASRSRVGADGGVDIIVRHTGHPEPAGYVQCKAWHVYTVGVKPIRELYGVMAADKVPHAFFVTTGSFTSEAIQFAQGKPLVLVSGTDLLKDLNELPEASRREILTEITSGDYTTPTCPRCDIKMVERNGPRGSFWGCLNYPRCRQTFQTRTLE